MEYLESIEAEEDIQRFLKHLMYKFGELREASAVPLTRIQRFSLEQYNALIDRLLRVASGGRFPLFLVVATFQAIKEFFQTDWEIEWQGINVADSPSGAGGDVTVLSDGRIVMAVEITERIVDRARLVSTFNTKIAPFFIKFFK